MSINELQDEVIAEFSDFDDWMDRYQLLIDLGNEQEPLEEKYKTEQNLIEGCQSRVWLQADDVDGKIVFKAESDALTQMIMIPAQLAGQIMMGIYLWKAGYISKKKATWLPVSMPFLICSGLAILTAGFLVSALMGLLDWIPNIMEQSFDILQSGWGGILAIAIIGPVLEEILFRGAITRALLQQYNPTKAILISALLFGVFHINPAQILPAFLIGILLAWTYYKTGSLIPCILMHVLNNSLSVYLSIKYPEAENMDDLINGSPYLVALVGSILLLICTILTMNNLTSRKQL